MPELHKCCDSHSTFWLCCWDESVRNASASVGFGDTVIGPPSSGPIVIKNEALLSFSSTDHATLLGLGDLDI